MTEEQSNPLASMTNDPAVDRPNIGKPVFAGLVIIAVFFLGFGIWAALAPLDSAAIASGAIRVDTNRKTIKHLEGGIVGRIVVRDGAVVKAGQPLIHLDETRPRATLELLYGKRFATAALQARLIAERDGRSSIVFSELLRRNAGDPKVIEAVEGQRNIFSARQQAISTRVQIQGQKIRQLSEEIIGLRGQIRAENTQLRLIKAEAKDIKSLVDKGLARRSRFLALQRQQAEIEGSRSRNRASISRAQQSIGEAKIRVSDIKTEQLNDVVVCLTSAPMEQIRLIV
jgi:HlyD family type I secretion membrane fusion protein